MLKDLRRSGTAHRESGPDALVRARVELARIRRHADDQRVHVVASLSRTCEDLVEAERERLIAKACRPYRDEETAAIRALAQRLDEPTRRQLFNETLDPHLLPDALARAVPRDLEPLILR